MTYFYAVPTVYAALLALPDFDRFDLRSLRLLGGGTAPMTAAQVRRIMERFGCRDMVILYGSTEAGPVSVLRPRDVVRRPESVGRPYLDVDVRLVDDEWADRRTGRVGEIAVRSEFTMQALLAQSGGDARAPSATAGCTRAISACSTPRDSSRSSDAARKSFAAAARASSRSRSSASC